MLACNPRAPSCGRPPPPATSSRTISMTARADHVTADVEETPKKTKRKSKPIRFFDNKRRKTDVDHSTKRTSTKFVDSFASKVKHLLPNSNSNSLIESECVKNEAKVDISSKNVGNNVDMSMGVDNNFDHPLIREGQLLLTQQRHRKVSDDSLLDAPTTDGPPNDPMTPTPSTCPASSTTQPPTSTLNTPAGSHFFLHRGHSFLSSFRSSFRRLTHKTSPAAAGDTPIFKGDTPTSTPRIDFDEEMSRLKLEDANSNDSQDSGLGEDSDLGDTSLVTSPRTPPPTSACPPPILRLATCSTVAKKHVVILEPNRTDLPSVRRQLFQRPPSPPRLETVRIVTLDVERDADHDNVRNHWTQLCQAAKDEVETVLQTLNLLDTLDNCLSNETKVGNLASSLNFVFSTENLNVVQEKLEDLDSDEISRLIFTVYKILFHDWTSSKTEINLVAIIIHCVQRFLVAVMDICYDLDAMTRLRLLRSFQQLLATSEDDRYRDLKTCFYSTRTLYIDFWCSLLDVRRHLEPLKFDTGSWL